MYNIGREVIDMDGLCYIIGITHLPLIQYIIHILVILCIHIDPFNSGKKLKHPSADMIGRRLPLGVCNNM